MNELEQLKKQNKQLKGLLKNAVLLLNRYKDVLQRSAASPIKKRKPAKRKTRAAK